jgi:serine/threonine protein kinase
MASRAMLERATGGRVPLGDGTSRGNVQRADLKPLSRSGPSSAAGPVARNESIVGDGTLDVRHTLPSPKHKRISAVAEDTNEGSKRNSAVSTTSTNASGGARRRKTHIGPWQLGQTIGKGGTSRVRKVRHVVTGEPAVAKIIPKAVADKNRSMSLANLVKSAEQGDPSLAGGKVIPFGLEREIVIMKLLNHRNIVRLFDVWENRNELYLIMEYVEDGELFEYVAQQHRLNEREAVYFFRQIITALLYCHRISIHHRDLKPENILLNLNTLEVKLVDFGMAALQPHGSLLTTPCGSPHYAAPEVIQMKKYDGSKADVWSCGVILFVMLTGCPPFNFPLDPHNQIPEDKKLKTLFYSICRAEYKIPSNLSVEAKDLISRIFISKPENRISIEQLWHHPLLHKYDHDFGLTGITMEASIGPGPVIENWECLTIKTIDCEIFRNLRTLWHDEKEEVLVQRLISEEPTQEKYFYSALLRYREENLENMMYTPGIVEYSASDHQHIKPPMSPANLPSITVSKSSHLRSKSQYSVLNNEHLYSRHSFFENPSEASYDPFRASREPITTTKTEYTNVTVHRGNSSGSKKLKPRLSSSRQPSSLRIEALRRSSRRGSGLSTTSRSIRGSPACRLSTSHWSSMSKTSMNSGKWLSSPPIAIIRPSSIHKRAVDFSHLRRSSTASGLTGKASSDRATVTPDQRRNMAPSRYKSGGSLPIPSSSPQHKVAPQVRSKKDNMTLAQPTPRTRKMKDIEQEARKVSTELEKVCEEAFFRSSVSSSIRSSITDKPSPFSDTPPSSVSYRSDLPRPKAHFTDKKTLANRPLPPIPASNDVPSAETETPRTFTARELAEVRERLAKTYAEKGLSSDRAFNDLLKQLDNLLPVDARRSGESGRSLSAAHHQPDGHSLLQAIPEEGRFADADAEIAAYEHSRPQRGLPASRYAQFSASVDPERDHTIRVVPASSPCPSPLSPTPVAPLNIRKRSDNSTAAPKVKANGKGKDLNVEIYDEDRSIGMASESSEPGGNPLTRTIDQSGLTPTQRTPKRPLWWKRKDQKQPKVKPVKPRPDFSRLDDRLTRHEGLVSPPSKMTPVGRNRLRERGVPLPSDSELSLEQRPSYRVPDPPQEKRGFFAFFRKKVEHVYKLKGTLAPSTAQIAHVEQKSNYTLAEQDSTRRGIESPLQSPSPTLDAGEPQNLLARIFRFKPEVKYLALRTGRDDALGWIFQLLEVHSYRGLRDIRYNSRYEIGVKVDKKNSKFPLCVILVQKS